ncbi:50S ribosomal protein L32e [Candidatus Pacearchaeota archaeon CG10_big_fil_rev_8_21_14_0_10_31_24]|nr:MAG: 50S ribosomal protein L32e [Candidatus Pacearchaeota archaeon CG10_big_fil_rev_8_21_14_0_10_31_24]
MKSKKPSFRRADTERQLRLGKKRPKLQKWRKPRGHHNKLRLKRVSYPAVPSVGYKSSRNESGKIAGAIPVVVNNLTELNKLTKDNVAIIARTLGAKRKIELIKVAEEKKIKIINLRRKK